MTTDPINSTKPTNSIQIQVNGKPQQLLGSATVSELLSTLGFSSTFLAVAINRACIRRSDFTVTEVKDGDAVEILAPMAGG